MRILSNFSHLLFSFVTGIIAGFFALLLLGVIHSVLVYLGAEQLISELFLDEIGEELVKFLLILFVLNLTISEKNEYFKGILFSVLVGLGFGVFELFLIISSSSSPELIGVILILLIHSLTSLFLGAAILFGKLSKNLILSVFFILIAIIIHFLYNFYVANVIYLP